MGLQVSVYSPKPISFMLEIIHVTALAQIQGVIGLQIGRRSHVDEVSSVLHYEVSLCKTFQSLKKDDGRRKDSN